MSSISVDNNIISSFRPSKLFKEHCPSNHIYTSSSYDDTGELFVTSSTDDNFNMFNAKTGKHIKYLKSGKYGIDLPRFTHKSSTIIHASTKEEDHIRYHSFHDNRYLQYFKGHTRRVTSLEMSPVSDQFLSAAADDTVRVWDLRTPQCMGMLNIVGCSVVAWDPSGLIFAVSLYRQCSILLYDTKEFDKAPFMTFVIYDKELEKISYPPPSPQPVSLKFSTDGAYLLVGTSTIYNYILDSFTGQIYYRLEGHEPIHRPHGSPNPSREELSWTPDSKYVVGGSSDGRVLIWEIPSIDNKPSQIKTLHPISSYNAYKGPVSIVNFNPKYTVMTTASDNVLSLWLPSMDSRRNEDEILK